MEPPPGLISDPHHPIPPKAILLPTEIIAPTDGTNEEPDQVPYDGNDSNDHGFEDDLPLAVFDGQNSESEQPFATFNASELKVEEPFQYAIVERQQHPANHLAIVHGQALHQQDAFDTYDEHKAQPQHIHANFTNEPSNQEAPYITGAILALPAPTK